MGEFDRHETPSATAGKEKKKLLIVGALGTVFLGILGFHLFKGPQVALAQSEEGAAAASGAMVVEQTPAQALAALDPARDPTAKLLLGPASLPARLSEVPRDPFRMSEQWRATLIKPVEVGRTEPVRPEPRMHLDLPPQALKADGFKLSGIFHQDQHLYAIINGSIVSAGMTIGTARVVDIHDDHVVLRPVDSPEGPTTTLNIQGKLP